MMAKKKPLNDSDLFNCHKKVFTNFIRNELKVSNSTFVILQHEYKHRVNRKNIRILWNLKMYQFLEVLLDIMEREIDSGDMKRYLEYLTKQDDE